ncbi:TetR/AcrR family transcriptional regulator [Streptomyces rubrogriseus]|uniref:TetR/AcrR family transcriptional regulator n=1 Tax=Streptomyces rubrogriseus TaxID=194673 RepID=UPI0037D48640
MPLQSAETRAGVNTDAPTKRPGGRSARVRAAVHGAAVALVAERGADQVTLPAVAERAGINSSTGYRRWGTLAPLLADVAQHRGESGAPPLVGDLRTDLENQAAWTLAELARPGGIAFFRPRSRRTSTIGTRDCVSVCAGSANASAPYSTRHGSGATHPLKPGDLMEIETEIEGLRRRPRPSLRCRRPAARRGAAMRTSRR